MDLSGLLSLVMIGSELTFECSATVVVVHGLLIEDDAQPNANEAECDGQVDSQHDLAHAGPHTSNEVAKHGTNRHSDETANCKNHELVSFCFFGSRLFLTRSHVPSKIKGRQHANRFAILINYDGSMNPLIEKFLGC